MHLKLKGPAESVRRTRRLARAASETGRGGTATCSGVRWHVHEPWNGPDMPMCAGYYTALKLFENFFNHDCPIPLRSDPAARPAPIPAQPAVFLNYANRFDFAVIVRGSAMGPAMERTLRNRMFR